MIVEEIDEREALFNAYLDGELSEQKRAEFDERLERDAEFRAAYREFASFVGEVRKLPRESAPEGFADNVRDRIRTRSDGRLFTDNLTYRQRPPHEKMAVAMLVIMASAYLFIGLSMDRSIDAPTETHLEVPASPLQTGLDR